MGLSHSPKIVTQDLVFAYDPMNTKCYTSGSTISDLSGNGHNATITGTATVVDNYFNIPGPTGNYITIGGDTSYNSVSAFTIDCFVYYTVESYYCYILSNSRDCCGTYQGFYFEPGYNTTHLATLGLWADTLVAAQSSSTIDLSKWYHLAASYDNSVGDAKIYVNGKLDKTTSMGTNKLGSPASFDLCLGNMGSNPNSYGMTGRLGPVKFFNRVLTDDEVFQNFNAMRGRFAL
jgi:hypothetical protein